MSVSGATPQPSIHCPQSPRGACRAHITWPRCPMCHQWPRQGPQPQGRWLQGAGRHLLLISCNAPGPSPHTCPRSPGRPSQKCLGCLPLPRPPCEAPTQWALPGQPPLKPTDFNWVWRLSTQQPIGIGVLGAPGTGQQEPTSSLTPSLELSWKHRVDMEACTDLCLPQPHWEGARQEWGMGAPSY